MAYFHAPSFRDRREHHRIRIKIYEDHLCFDSGQFGPGSQAWRTKSAAAHRFGKSDSRLLLHGSAARFGTCNAVSEIEQRRGKAGREAVRTLAQRLCTPPGWRGDGDSRT
jgi:hypothetical protein